MTTTQTGDLTTVVAEAAAARTFEIWIIGSGPKTSVKNMTKHEALAVYAEFVRQVKLEGWQDMEKRRKVPDPLLSKLERNGEMMLVGVIDNARPTTQPIPKWLTRIPVVAHE